MERGWPRRRMEQYPRRRTARARACQGERGQSAHLEQETGGFPESCGLLTLPAPASAFRLLFSLHDRPYPLTYTYCLARYQVLLYMHRLN